ncbi:UspA domain-containing protein [Natronococcus amylolyticus DSM 10524]|uniref:UspA domain-containing protein n=1 Tax=Natronococcus amylolyticus DSM 10524 TaxID=1227497 RepID=L9X608_9EURY|nr:universal stress protein [Natronococcus amylolyticus]ELY56896.1 UspA domain-containing protein [Natronococcus amylolyticus DSM 10524]
MTQPVFDRILLPIAEENHAVATCDAVRPYLTPTGDIVVLHVIEKTEGGPDKAPIGARQEQADAIFEIVREELAGTGHDVRTELRYGTDVIDEILAAAEEVDTAAIGFTPRPGSRWIKLLSGDHAHRLTTETELPVLVFPHPEKKTPEISEAAEPADDDSYRVLVPIDGSELSWKALEHACSVYLESDVTVLYVDSVGSPGVYDSMTSNPSFDANADDRRKKRQASRLFERARELATERGVELSTIALTGNVVKAIVTCAENTDTDLIVMASHGRVGLKQKLLGSTTEAVIRRSNVPPRRPQTKAAWQYHRGGDPSLKRSGHRRSMIIDPPKYNN